MFQMYMNLFGKGNIWKNMIVVITKLSYCADYESNGEWIDEMDEWKEMLRAKLKE